MEKFTTRGRLKLLVGAAALLLSACGGGGGNTAPVVLTLPAAVTTVPTPAPVTLSLPVQDNTPVEGLLRDTFTNNFKVGTALSAFSVREMDLSGQIAIAQFNSITPEFELKADQLTTAEDVYDFTEADRLVDWALANNMEVRGHALVWHESTPDYFFEGTRDEIRARLELHITTVMEHFKGRIKIWDVVNEATSVDLFNGDDGIGPDRRSNWYEAVGNADYIDWAFHAARAADPTAKLFLSDYETENPFKRVWFIEILQRLISRGVPIDGIGHQAHLQIDSNAADLLAAVDAIDNEFAGLINHITELDVNFYQDPGSCWESGTDCQADFGEAPPKELLISQAAIMRALFDGLKLRSSVEVVSMWGVIDSDSWLNFSPVTRFNHPLLFDRNGDPKSAFKAITDPNHIITD